jgi:hypothetical protein
MMTPATTASRDLYMASNWPTLVEIAPRAIKTTLNPAMKAMEFSMSLRSRPDSRAWSSSTPTPDINDT